MIVGNSGEKLNSARINSEIKTTPNFLLGNKGCVEIEKPDLMILSER